ncbi:MAG TPA: type IV secretion protein DotN [Alphaproteobacteria bacterium]|nr:type IV secretion protein DotN [Alphaproteobacteria bacterium]
MSFLPIVLGVRRASDAENALSSDRNKRRAQIQKTLERDDYACRFCGFRALKYQHAVPYAGAGGDSFVTACGFCEQCLLLDRAGLYGSGVLAWLPEIAQAELNHIMRAAYVALGGNDQPLAAAAARARDALLARRQEAKKRIGSDDPLMLATVLYESLEDNEYARAPAALEGIRLLPLDRHVVRRPEGDVNEFSHMVDYWRSPAGPYGKLPVETWGEMFRAVQGVEAPAEGQG